MANEKLSIDEELKQLEFEEKKLRVEHLRMTVENERARRDQILRSHEQQQASLDAAMRQIQADQSICKHKKGGKNLEGIVAGNDPNYSVSQHTYPWGEIAVLCTRCGKEWRKPAEQLKAEDKDEYKRQMAEYVAALNFPTDNEPSGTQIFVITKNPVPAKSARA